MSSSMLETCKKKHNFSAIETGIAIEKIVAYTSEGNEKAENIIRAFKNAENPQVSENLFQTIGWHKTVASQDLKVKTIIIITRKFVFTVLQLGYYLYGFVRYTPICITNMLRLQRYINFVHNISCI